MRPALALIGLLLLSGCVVGNAEIAAEVDTVLWDLRPLRSEPRAELHVGSGLIGLASTASRWSDDPDADFAADMLDGIEGVHLGVYELQGDRRDAPADLTWAAREELEDLGWQVVVRTREHGDESSWVFGRTVDDDRFEMLVVALEWDEAVVVRIDGDPGRLLRAAVRRDEDFVVATRSVHAEF